jgi:hypothetical protein
MSAITNYFQNAWNISTNAYPPPQVTMEEHSHPAFISCDCRYLREVPVALVPYVIEADPELDKIDTIAFNLVNGFDSEGRRTLHYKTVSTILRMFYHVSYGYERMAHIVTSKGVHYYGNGSLILDANYNPLFVCTVSMSKVNNHWEVSEPTCMISYRVFINSSELLEKTIIKQAIPMYSCVKVYCYLDGRSSLPIWVKVIIDDLDYMVSRPARPKIEEVTPEAINNIILEGYDGL